MAEIKDFYISNYKDEISKANLNTKLSLPECVSKITILLPPKNQYLVVYFELKIIER